MSAVRIRLPTCWTAWTPPPCAAGASWGSTRCAARGALLGARGNSGVILSQILRGLADALAAAPLAGGRALATALATASSAAYQAVAQPVEGTILTVVRAAAQAAAAADSDDLATVARAAADAARAALARTPEQLPVLARAGVVDAGGRGLCVMLDALVEVITGERPSDEPVVPASVRPPLTMARESGSDDYAYEVQFLLDATETAVAPLKQSLAKLGDSLVVVGGDGTWNVHVHVNDVGAAVEAGVEAGRPHRITVTRFADQQAPAPAPVPAVDHTWASSEEPGGARGVVVVAGGEGLTELFEAEGATVISSAAAAPSTAEILAGIKASGARFVVILPNDPNVAAAAAAAAAEAREAGIQDGEVNLIGKDLTQTCRLLLDRLLAGGGELVTLVTGAQAPPELADALVSHLGERWQFVEVQTYHGGQPHYPLLIGVE